MKSKYDLKGIHHTGTSFTHSSTTTDSVAGRVNHLNAHRQPHGAADLAPLVADLRRLGDALHEDGKILTGVTSHMRATEKKILAMMGPFAPVARLYLRTTRGDARKLVTKHKLEDDAERIRYGATGAKVKSLQRRLKAAGYNPGPLDGDYGPKTRHAVQAFEKAHHLKVTGGGLSKDTAHHLGRPGAQHPTTGGSTPIGQGHGGQGHGHDTRKERGHEVVKLAATQLGAGEHPPGSNVTKYGDWYNPHDRSEPWCARFVSWVYAKTGHPLPHIQDAKGFQYVPYGVTWAKNHHVWHGGLHGVQPGDIVCFDWNADGEADHTGIATSTRHGDGTVSTIEGNDRNNVVGRHIRGGPTVMGYFRP
jgi:peptidoglycan hydrolase-like protein with peptidoglycan-binding domain